MEWCHRYCGCHQMPERSFFISGYQFPLCARCTGIVLGHIVGIITAPLITFSFFNIFLIIPMAIDGTLQYFTNYRSNNFKRILTGFLYGFFTMSTIIYFLERIIKRLFQKET